MFSNPVNMFCLTVDDLNGLDFISSPFTLWPIF